MNFLESQAQAQRRSRVLILLFVVAALAETCAVGLIFLPIWLPTEPTLPKVLASGSKAGAAVLAAIIAASLWRSYALAAAGGAGVAIRLRAVSVLTSTVDEGQRRLRNVVEEIAIACGLPIPRIFILQGETGINAFVAGYSSADAAIVVTQGAIERLKRDELQGVVAHEFSHILNGDMRLNMQLMGLLHGILLPADLGEGLLGWGLDLADTAKWRRLLLPLALGSVLTLALAWHLGRWRFNLLWYLPWLAYLAREWSFWVLMLLLLVLPLGGLLMLVGYTGFFFGGLIKASVSRQREFLADASAVQFTRQTAGVAGALKKIASLPGGARVRTNRARQVSHMLFADSSGRLHGLATHPPILDRIRALEPEFNRNELREIGRRLRQPGDRAEEVQPGSGAPAGASPVVEAAFAAPPLRTAQHDCAVDLHRALPPELLAAARDRERAEHLVLALLLSRKEEVRSAQFTAIVRGLGSGQAVSFLAQSAPLAELPPAQRLPLIAIALSVLREQPPADLMRLVTLVSEVIHADAGVDLFEFCLGRMLRLQVAEALRPGARRQQNRQALGAAAGDIQCLLSVVAWYGADDTAAAQRAFQTGMAHLPLTVAMTYQVPEPWTGPLDVALRTLDEYAPAAKGMLLQAVEATIVADGKLTVEEAELLRTICASLHCPLPPLLQQAPAATAPELPTEAAAAAGAA